MGYEYYKEVNGMVYIYLTEPKLNKLNVLEHIGNYYGFEIDGNRRFVLENFSVTHNTVIALNIITQLHKKHL